MPDGEVECAAYTNEQYARNDYLGREGWPLIKCDVVMLYEHTATGWQRRGMQLT